MEYHRARILAALSRDAEAAELFQRALARPDLLDFHVQRELRAAALPRGYLLPAGSRSPRRFRLDSIGFAA